MNCTQCIMWPTPPPPPVRQPPQLDHRTCFPSRKRSQRYNYSCTFRRSRHPPSSKDNVPPQDVPHKLPRKMRPRRRNGGQPGTSTNHNSPAWNAGMETPRALTANQNSASWEAAREMRPGSTTNHNSPLWTPGSQPGTSRSPGSAMHAPVKHPLTIQPPHLSQPPTLSTNHNSERRFDPDLPESGRLYKPASSSIQQDSALRSRRDSFSGSGLSSPALQRSHRDSFSGSPAGPLHKKSSFD